VAYGICIHFAAVDWIMSLQPAFKSSIFGPLVASGQVLTGMAWMLIVLAWLASRPPLEENLSLRALTDLGSLFFAFLVIWGYMEFFQFMLIWMANLPLEVIWYLDRSRGGWQWVAWAVFVLHFAVPFFLLLQRTIKRDTRRLGYVAGLMLLMHLVYQHWLVQPAFFTTSLAQHWMDFLMPIGLGGIWIGFYLWQLQRRPLLPRHDINRPCASASPGRPGGRGAGGSADPWLKTAANPMSDRDRVAGSAAWAWDWPWCWHCGPRSAGRPRLQWPFPARTTNLRRADCSIRKYTASIPMPASARS
jgi:hypothetical protein